MGLGKSGLQGEPPEFGAAADGDADRNMILGKRYPCTEIIYITIDILSIVLTNAFLV